MSDIKILISCHKNTDYVANRYLKPIQVGCDRNKTQLQGILHDNEGQNISSLNNKYCELTAQYWAWKNLDADYYGFFHYRRYLSFAKLNDKYDSWGNLIRNYITDETLKELKLDEENIAQLVEKYDVILPELKDIKKFPHNAGRTMRALYASSGQLNPKDLETMLLVIKEKYPEYAKEAETYLNGSKTYLNNMFIMKKHIFIKYSEWLFDILGECSKRIDDTNYSIEGLRTLGHLAERLLNIYCIHLKNTTDYKFKELQTVAFVNTDPFEKPKPAFKDDNVAIVLSANDFYVPYVAVLLESIKQNIDNNRHYDIIIINRDISKISEKNCCSIFDGFKNVSLRFLNVSRFDEEFKHLPTHGHFKLETYFRLLMPDIMPDYNKAIYIDSDLVVCDDLAKLYDENIDGYLLAACKDADTAGLYNGFEKNKKKYMDTVLKIKNPYEYFQAGVILFNLDEFRKKYSVEEMLRFATSRKWELLDQDVLNYLAQGHVKFVDMSWNCMYDWRNIRLKEIISRAPKYLYDEYVSAHKHPKIIHYAGPDKPWHQPYSDYADIFWDYARNTIYYEELIHRLGHISSLEILGSHTPHKKSAREVLEVKLDGLFPRYTRRREIVKSIWRKINHEE